MTSVRVSEPAQNRDRLVAIASCIPKEGGIPAQLPAEAKNSKSEIRMTNQGRRSNNDGRNKDQGSSIRRADAFRFEFRPSSFEFVSSFEFRHSNFPAFKPEFTF
jgi:hypothetical protein